MLLSNVFLLVDIIEKNIIMVMKYINSDQHVNISTYFSENTMK